MNPRTIVDDLQELRPDISDGLSRSVEAALSNKELLAHDYSEPSEFVSNNFAEAGLDDESDRRAEATVRDHVARAEEVELLGQAFRDVQHMKLHGLLLGRAYFDTSAELSRLGRRGVINGRKSYGTVFGQNDLTEDEFNFGRGGLGGIYFDDMMNISGRGRLITAPVLASGPGGAGDSGDEGEVEYSYAHVKDLVEMDVALRAFQLLVEEVAHTQAHRHKYLDTGPHWHGHWHEIDGGALSHGHEHEHEQLTIYLEDDRAGGDDLGRAPLPYVKDDGTVPYEDELDNMYLGSLPTTVDEFEVGYSVGTILHEFGHVIDRRTGFTAALYEPVPEDGGISRQYSLGGMYGLNVNIQIPERGVQGFGAKQAVYNELGIAPFVTDVVAVSGETLHMFSILPDSDGEFPTFGSDFYDCSERGGCDKRPIDWRRSSSGELTNNATALRRAFREVLGGFLHQLIEGDMHE